MSCSVWLLDPVVVDENRGENDEGGLKALPAAIRDNNSSNANARFMVNGVLGFKRIGTNSKRLTVRNGCAKEERISTLRRGTLPAPPVGTE